ncbi:MAG TPA: zf-HC2 domain-containing protein [Nocardioides sp.]|nr:zf-HC2 domain-containing protein [Nocardioides sp.]
MIGHHLGSRASALLDGQLSPEETERAWEHVHTCHACRDLVEREGWVKTRLAGLTFEVAAPTTPSWLKGSILGACPTGGSYLTVPGAMSAPGPADHRRRTLGLAALGGSAVGAAVMGVLVFGVAPADAPTIDRRAPVTSITNTDAPRTPSPSAPTAQLTRGARQQ